MLKRIKLNWDLLGLTLCLLIFNFQLLNPRFVFVGDAFFNFNFFYFVYNDFFFNGQLAQWLPYGAYGLPAVVYQLTGLGPMCYLTLFLGYLCRVKDVLLLFKMALIGEQIIFLLGMYLLCRFLFKRRSTVFLICLCAAGSPACHAQLFFNFHIYYFFPMVAYLWLLFFFKKRPQLFWLGCLTCLLWFMSCPLYFVPLQFFVLFFFSIIFFLNDKKIWRCLFAPSISNCIFFSLFFLFTGVYAYFVKNGLVFLALNSPARSASGSVDLVTFLTWGGNPTIPMLIKSFFFARPAHLQIASFVDNTVYIGLAALVFFAWAILRVREKIFLAFLIPAVVLVWLSFGGIFARAVYYLMPLMSYYRHIGLVLTLVKILMLICAGFGFENFLATPLKKKIYYLLFIFALIVFLFDSGPQSCREALNIWYFKLSLKDIWGQVPFSHELIRFGIYLIVSLISALLGLLIFIIGKLRKKASRAAVMGRCAIIGLMIACFLDLLSFQQAAIKEIPRLSPQHYDSLDSVLVNKLQFQEERFFMSVFDPPKKRLSERQLHALNLFYFSGSGVYSSVGYNFLQVDPLSSEYKEDMLEHGVDRLRQIQSQDQAAALIWGAQLKRALNLIGPDFNVDLVMKGVNKLRKVKRLDKTDITVFGGYYSKLRLVPNAYFAKDSAEALAAVGTLPDIVHTVVLTGRKDAKSFSPSQANSTSANSGKVEVTHFSANELFADVSVENPDGAWLVYADAYHPGWQATVAGRRAPVFEAYGAFKAIHLDPGQKKIKFFFFNGLGSVCSYVIALFGLISGCILLMIFLAELLNKRYINKRYTYRNLFN